MSKIALKKDQLLPARICLEEGQIFAQINCSTYHRRGPHSSTNQTEDDKFIYLDKIFYLAHPNKVQAKNPHFSFLKSNNCQNKLKVKIVYLMESLALTMGSGQRIVRPSEVYKQGTFLGPVLISRTRHNLYLASWLVILKNKIQSSIQNYVSGNRRFLKVRKFQQQTD